MCGLSSTISPPGGEKEGKLTAKNLITDRFYLDKGNLLIIWERESMYWVMDVIMPIILSGMISSKSDDDEYSLDAC